ncbi:ABC transporter substrate-binding protein [Paenibacillus marchantiophytorum]|uniref:ABC transporter substrate-binding protein n=1 Tax=Paenibacillus marchantiophytorum TaxID=1619310 RepID=A0ABQ1EQX5_9BACL|nr:ABC transporter substrate-binding protein [Paenibacillus marchantiophytorum]GFZ83360.1 ABC transporter substrate-binding protein [Paenibacillus marchantiophytorum]
MKKLQMKAARAALMLAIFMSFTVACSKEEGNNPQTSPANASANSSSTAAKSKAEGTVKIVLPGDAPKDLAGVQKAMEEKLKTDGLNIKLDFTYFPWDQYNNKLNLIAASGENYDLAWTHVSWLSQIAAKNVIIPLNDLIAEQGQQLKADIPAASFASASIEQMIYGIPTLVPSAENNNFFVIRGDLREKYKLAPIKTLADFENYLDTIKKNEPNMVPIANDNTRGLLREFGDIYLPIGDYGAGPAYIDPADKSLQVKNFYESEIFKNIVKTKRKWYLKGWFPKDAQEIKDSEAALNNGKIAATWSNVLKTSERIDAFKAGVPTGTLEDVFLNPEKPKYVFDAASNLLSVFSTSKNSKAAIAFVNWSRSSKENYDLFSYGVNNVNYKLDGNAVSTQGIADKSTYNQVNWAWDDIRMKRFSKNVSPSYIENLKVWDKNAVVAPTLGFRFNADPVKSEIAQIDAVGQVYVGVANNGYVEYDDFYPEFKSKLKAAGIDKVIAEVQKQLNDFVAKKAAK